VTVAADTLAPAVVEPHLRGRFGKPYLFEPECESTQTLLVGSGLAEGAVATTDHQTAGRGRRGGRWEAPPGTSVLSSVMLHPPAGRHLPELTLVAALAAAEAVEGATGLTAQIKWPNDVMIDRSKVAGLLADLVDGVVVVGIGINVNQTREQLPLNAATQPGSLRTVTGDTHDRAALLGSLLVRLERAYDGWRHGGLTAVYGELGARDFVRGRRVTIDGRPGTAVMIQRDGQLEVAFDDGDTVPVESGVLHVER
jgi:BirA family transcriptional regulator, biotin operon repressor / biotin---[acetyl-CoA-carboxylase] ligase